MVLTAGVYSYRREIWFVFGPFQTCRTLESAAYLWSALALKRALWIYLSRLLSFELIGRRAWLIDDFLDMAGAGTTRPMMKVFLMACLSMVTVFGCTLMIRNGRVLRGKSFCSALVGCWYAS